MDEAHRRKLLALIGLGLRGGLTTVGVEQVRAAAKRGTLVYAVIAADASRHSVEKVVPLLRAKRIGYVQELTAATLGAAVGRESTAAIGIVDRQLARGIRELVELQASPDRAP